jgi:hypothetical protein
MASADAACVRLHVLAPLDFSLPLCFSKKNISWLFLLVDRTVTPETERSGQGNSFFVPRPLAAPRVEPPHKEADVRKVTLVANKVDTEIHFPSVSPFTPRVEPH